MEGETRVQPWARWLAAVLEGQATLGGRGRGRGTALASEACGGVETTSQT